MIYFAQIAMLRLRKISPNCAQIVLEKEKITHFLLARSKFLLENHGVFEKIEKMKKFWKQKISVENTVFFPIKSAGPARGRCSEPS